MQLVHLVLAERLGREQVQGPGLGILETALQDREVVAEGLSTGGRRDHDLVAASPGMGAGLALVGIEFLDTPRRECIAQTTIHEVRERYGAGCDGIRRMPQGYIVHEGRSVTQTPQQLAQVQDPPLRPPKQGPATTHWRSGRV